LVLGATLSLPAQDLPPPWLEPTANALAGIQQCGKSVAKGAPDISFKLLDAHKQLTLGLLKDMARLEPYGAHNPKPKFMTGGLEIVGQPKKIGQGERHLSFNVSQGPTRLRTVAFGMSDRLEELMSAGGKCCLAYTPMINEWQGRRSVELNVIDFQAGPEARLG